MGAVEEGGKAVSGVIDALRASPILLVLLIFNAGFFVMLHYATSENRSRQSELVNHLLENQARMTEMLARCSGPRSEIPATPPS